MQVEIDEETVQFIVRNALENYWTNNSLVMKDCDYRWNDDDDDRHNLIEMLYRIYTKNKEKFEGV